MKIWAQIAGIPELKAAIQKEAKAMATNWQYALTAAALLVQRESQLLTPVEFGVLKNSANTRRVPNTSGWEVQMEVFYTAYYAVYVHENLYAKHTNGEAEFLKKAVERNKEKVNALIIDYMKNGGFAPKGAA